MTVRVATPLDEIVREVPEEELPPLWLVGDPFPEAELPPLWLVGDPFSEAELPTFPVDDIPLSVELLPEEELPMLPLVNCPLERIIALPEFTERETVWATGVKLVLVMPP